MPKNQIHEKLEYSENLFKAITEQSGEGISLADTAGNYVFVNKAFCEMTGYSQSELIKMNVRNLIPSDINISLFPKIVKKQSGSRETELMRKNGSRFWSEIKGYPIELDGNNFVLGIVRNITDQRYNEIIIEKFFEQPMNIHLITDFDGKIHRINTGCYNILGYSKEELEGTLFFDLIHPDDWDSTNEEMVKLGQGKTIFYFENRYRHKDGDYRQLAWSAIASTQDQHVYAIATDITGQKQTEVTLAKEQKFIHTILDSAQTGVFIYNLKQKQYEYVNPRHTELVGYTQDQMNKIMLEELVHPNDMENAYIHFNKVNHDKTNKIYEHEFRLKRSDGNWIWCLSWDSVFERDTSGEAISFIGTIQDITDRKKNELINKARLHLLEFAEEHSVEDLFEETLNETEKLTNSSIGFYHFVKDDQNTIILQNWSTNTKEKFCKVEGKGAHYPIELAGVWVDCVHQRKPVIHNDYASLKHKKGMPEGHAKVIREIVVPIMRGNKITAILGIGNKSTEYSQVDVDTVSNLADLSWDIVERKRAEEALQESEERNRILLQNGSDGIHILDMDGYVIEANASFCAMLGYEQNEIIGMNVSKWDAHFKPEDISTIIREQYNTQSRLEFSSIHKRKNGSTFEVEISGQPMELKGQQLMFYSSRDISERKLQETLIKESEQRFRALFEYSSDAIALIENMFFIDCNNALLNLIGYKDKSELIGKSPAEFSPEFQPDGKKSIDKANELFKLVFKKGSQRFEWVHLRPNGEEFFVDVNLTRINERERQIVHCIWRDITNLKYAELALRQSEEQFRLIFQNSPLGIYIADTNGKILSANMSLVNMLGSPSVEATRKINVLKFPTLVHNGYAENFKMCVKENKTVTLEMPYTTKWGKEIFLSTYIIPLADSHGNVEKVYTIMEDIAIRKKGEEILRKSEDGLKQAQKIAHLGNWTWNIEKNTIEWSDEIYRIFGMNSKEFIPSYEAFIAAIHPDDRDFVLKSVENAMNLKTPFDIEHRILRKDKVVRYVHGNGHTIFDENDKPIEMVGIIHDITEKKQVDEKLKNFNAALIRSNQDLEDFAYVASHDLQEPLRKIISFAERLKLKYVDQLPEQGQYYLERIDDASVRMRTLIDDLLSYSRVATKTKPFENVDLNEQLNIVLSDIEISAKEKNATIKIEKLPVIHGDKIQMRQLFQNILTNAIKFSKPGESPFIKIQKIKSPKDQLCIEVTDNGIGFEQEFAEKIFLPFNRLHSREDFEGSGIGLAVCKKIVERHGGKIEAKSRPDRGTKFIIHLPVEKK